MEFLLFFVYLFLIFGSLYGYYRLVKWLTYDFFTTKPEKTENWVRDYVVVYTKKLFGIILILPIAVFLIAVFAAAAGKSSGRKSIGSSSSYGSDDEEYVIQYRRGRTWIDGPGSNDERTAESMFDQFLDTDPRAENRCRLVYKVNGRVQSVLSTN